MTTKKMKEMTTQEKTEIAAQRKKELLEKLEECSPRVKESFNTVPDTMARLFLDVHCGENARLKRRIKLKCLDCSCWQREEVKLCTVYQCALWKVRPFQ